MTKVGVDPAFDAFRIGAAVGRPDLAVVRGLFPDIGDGNAGEEIGDLLVLDGAGRAADDEAAQTLRLPCRIIERGETAARDAEQMESIEPEMIDEGVKVGGDARRFGARRPVGHALAPAATVEGDDPEAGLREGGDLAFPDLHRAGVGMQEYDRRAGAAGVDEP